MSKPPVIAICVLLAGITLTGCGTAVSHSEDASPALAVASTGAQKLAGSSLFVNPEDQANAAIRQLQAQGSTHEAEQLEPIAQQPVATWFTSETPLLGTQVHALVSAAAEKHSLPLIVAYEIPDRDCGAGFSSGGAATPTAYLAWVGRLAAAIGNERAIVILEPDAIPDIVNGCLSGGGAQTRLRLLSKAITILKRGHGTLVYLDAGNAGWIKPARRLVAPLRAAGLAKADGFSLNVANFETTAASVAYGNTLSRALHGAHFVIDTSRNGNGVDNNPADSPNWCDPPGRALGHPPSTNTGIARVDAFLWVKQPGASDGSCRPGAPAAGQWWTQYALQLAATMHH